MSDKYLYIRQTTAEHTQVNWINDMYNMNIKQKAITDDNNVN